MSRSGCTTVVVALVLGFAAQAAPADRPPSQRQIAVTAKKKCKKGKVRERIGKKTRCVPARKALPKPKAIDVRKAATSFVLNADWSKLRDRRGKRLPSLPKLLRRVHPRAEKALVAATNAGLAKLDRAQASLARSAAAPCGSGSGSISSTFDAGGGMSVEMRATLGPDASLQLGLESRNGNRRVRFEVEFPACDENGSQIESCPTADGIVRGRDNQRIRVRAVVLEGSTETWSQGITLHGETTFRGVVADDAKLDFMEPHNTEQATLTLGGSSRGFEPVTIRTLVQRITRVNMRTGDYVLGPSIVDVSISSRGFEGAERRATEAEIAGRMRAQADKQFADIIAKAIEKYRRAEDGWNQPNTCATFEFTPASNTKPLHLGETGAVGARVQAKPGGSPSGASWTLLSSANAPFSPASASANPTSFTYGGVADAGPGISVSGSFKAVSKAGVAQGTWTQPTEDVRVNTIAGTFAGTWNNAGSIFSWAGNATFTRGVGGHGANGIFTLTSGSYTVIASGRDASGATGCQQAGTKTVTMTGGDLTVTGQEPTRTPPYDYSGSVVALGPEASSMTVRLSSCPPGAEEFEGADILIGLAFTALDTRGNHRSADGLDYTGSSSQEQSPITANWNWTMRGTP